MVARCIDANCYGHEMDQTPSPEVARRGFAFPGFTSVDGFEGPPGTVGEPPSVAQSLFELVAGQRRIEHELACLRLDQQATLAAVRSWGRTAVLDCTDVFPMQRTEILQDTRLRSEPFAWSPDDGFFDSPQEPLESQASVCPSPTKETKESEISDNVAVLTSEMTERCEGEACWPTTVARRVVANADGLGSTLSQTALADDRELDTRITNGLTGIEVGCGSAGPKAKKVPILRTFVLHPNSVHRSILDFIGLCVLAFDLTVTPLVLAWDIDVRGQLSIMSVLVALWWSLDIFFNFHTGYFSDGLLEMDHIAVAKRYLRWFPVDALVTIMDWVGIAISFSNQNDSNVASLSTYPRIVKAGKVVRLMNFVRVGRFFEPLQRMGDQFVSKVLHHIGSMIVVFALLFLLNHVLACCWYALAMSPSTDTGYRWTDIPLISDAQTYAKFDVLFQYLTAFHWTLTQMTPGSMPVQPTNSLERVFNIVCLFLGLLFFSSVISSMASALTQLKLLAFEREKIITELETFLRRNAVSRELAVALKKQVVRRISQRKPLEMGDVSAIPMLSLTLKEDLMFDLCKEHLRGHELFRLVEQTDTTVLRSISTKAVRFKALLPQDVLFVADTMCDDAYIVAAGSLDYTEQFSSLSRATLVESSEDRTREMNTRDWLCWAALWSHWVHVGKAEARSVSEVMVLNSGALLTCISRCAELRAFFDSYSATFHKRLISASPSSAGMWPNDVQVPLTMYGEIVLGMPQREQKFVGSKALEKLEAQFFLPWKGLSVQSAHELEREVLSGQSVLVENADGQVERVVAFTGLRLLRGDGNLLVVLAKKRLDGDEGYQPEGQLPGVKQLVGELPSQALRRMLLGQLRPFADWLTIQNLKREDRHEESASLKIPTKYIRVIYSGSLPETCPELHTLVEGSGLVASGSCLEEDRRSRRSVSVTRGPVFFQTRHVAQGLQECHVLHDSRAKYLCAFLTPHILDWFRKSSGRKQLTHWVSNLPSHLVGR